MWSVLDPIAIDDYGYSMTGDHVTGNVLLNDYGVGTPYTELHLASFNGVKVGAKTPGQVTTVDGQYGTFTLKADGTYTYQLSDTYKSTDLTHNPLTEKIQYKTADGYGHTDVGTLTLDVGQMVHATQPSHEITVNFDGKVSPFVYLQYAITFDEGSNISIGNENGNNYWRADAFGEGFFSKDGSDFILHDMLVATGDLPGTTAEVRFIGRHDGGDVGSVTVEITANMIAQHQHIDLSSLGPIDGLRYQILDLSDNWDGEPTLRFDDIHMTTV